LQVEAKVWQLQLKDLFSYFNFYDKVITYMKDESANINTFTIALTSALCHCSTHVVRNECYQLLYQNVVSMLLMIWKFVESLWWSERGQKCTSNYVENYYMDQKMWKASKDRLELAKMHPYVFGTWRHL